MINKIDEFKNRLNRALSLRNVKPVELAQRTKISESTISQYRSGYAKPKADKLSLIADALDVNPAWLMGLDVPMEIEKLMSFETPEELEAWWIDHNGGRHPIELSRLEEQIIRHYRIADDKTKAMVKMMLEITDPVPTLDEKYRVHNKEVPHLDPTHVGRYAARKHTDISKKLTKRRNDNK